MFFYLDYFFFLVFSFKYPFYLRVKKKGYVIKKRGGDVAQQTGKKIFFESEKKK